MIILILSHSQRKSHFFYTSHKNKRRRRGFKPRLPSDNGTAMIILILSHSQRKSQIVLHIAQEQTP